MAIRASRLLHAGLVRLDPETLLPIPYAARSWSWLDDRTLRVELRDDVFFHSGAPLRAADVVATLRALASPAVQSRHARAVEAIADAVPDGDLAVRIVLEHAHATLLTDLEVPILRADQAASPPRPDGTLDGIGPFTLETRTPGAIHLRAAPRSLLGGAPRPVVLRTVHDENARALRMHAGRADLVVNGFSPTLLPAMEGGDLMVTGRPGANLTYMLVRSDRGPLADRRVREALALAIDRAGIAQTLLAGRATVAATLLPPIHWAYSPAEPIAFDPARARAMLAEAGAVGVHLSLLTSTDRLRGTIARTIAQELHDVGIELEVVPLELGTMIARLGAGDFELATLQMPELTEPHVLRVFLHGSQVPPAGANRGRIHDDALDRALDLGGREPDVTKRIAIYARVERQVRDHAWMIPLWHEDHVTVSSARARGFTPSADGRWLGLASLR